MNTPSHVPYAQRTAQQTSPMAWQRYAPFTPIRLPDRVGRIVRPWRAT